MKRFQLFITILYLSSTLQAQEEIHIAPWGSALGEGTVTSPYGSLNSAVSGRLDNIADTLYVYVAPGDYYMDRPFSIEQASSRPIVVKSTGKDRPRFIGGIKIEGWQKYGEQLYRAYIPEVLSRDFTFEQFYVNERKATLARTPNQDWFEVKNGTETAFVKGLRAPEYAVQQIQLDSLDIRSLHNMQKNEVGELKFRFYHKWDITQKQADYLDLESASIYIRGKGMQPWNPIGKGSRYVISNYFTALDEPGEWFLDKNEGYIYYMPLPGEDMNEVACFAPALHQLVILKGEPDNVVKNIKFENLSFQYSSYLMPKGGEDPIQAAAYTEAMVMMDYAENVTFLDCEVMNTGAYAIWLRRECHKNRIERCFIANLGAGGIKVGEPYFRNNGRPVSSNNVINNNIITHAGSELPSGVGIAMFHTAHNEVTHNDISDLRYSGVSIGWIWGYNDSADSWTTAIDEFGKADFIQARPINQAVGNKVEYNRIHHIGWGELSDMGAVYTLGESPGTTVSYNVIHDVLSYDYGGWGLYTDEGSAGITMTHNLVYRCKSGGFHQHYGKNNKIENNIFAFGHYYQAQFTRVEPHLSFSFKHNIIIQDKGETLSGPWESGNIDMDHNLYWHLSEAISIGKHTFKEWRKIKEPNSIIADPGFKDVANDNFEFRSLRAANKIGFEPFDYSKAGVYGPKEWIDKAQLSDDIIEAFKKAASTRLKK